jgi:predicted nucleic acid-binding protein
MAEYFLDSSALVKRYVEEPGTDRVVQLLDKGHRLVVSHLAKVEVTSALARRERAGKVAAEQVDAVVGAMDAEFREVFEVVELGGEVLGRAAELTRAHALKASDAIQLACALVACSALDASAAITMVCADRELNAAAEQEGLPVVDPTEVSA